MPLPPASIGAAVPRLAAGVEAETVDGRLRLRSPVLRRSGFMAWLARLARAPERIEVELDDIGAFVVERLDGRDLDAIAAALAAHLRLTRREAETSVAEFLRQLIRRRLVSVDAATGRAA